MRRTIFSVWGAGAVALIIVLGLAFMWVFGIGWFQKETADFRGDVDQTERTIADGAYRIAAYEHFYDLCSTVQDFEDMIVIAEAELASNPDAGRKQQVNANIAVYRMQREAAINEYNADARKEDTQGNFRASDLPYQLDSSVKETTCTAS